ncbi:MAG: HD domain-containing protein [gamma proteobacterium symbiont of Taylorina sp.]|nr:HD domain-containing protein [gamma proteobacterium symbiont of Taylorina sp.]
MNISNNKNINTLLNSVLKDIQYFVEKQDSHIENLNKIGAALSSENHLESLLEMILAEAQKFTNADGGTLYLMSNDEQSLSFVMVETKSLGIRMGGNSGKITWPNLNLYKESGLPNREMVAALCALDKKIVNIEDVYKAQGFNFDGTKSFDESTGFHSKSMLVIPMKNHEGEVIGVCQLINRQDQQTGEVISFSEQDENSVLSLASQAAVAISNVSLINDLRELLESFIRTIAHAIDAKSPYTGGHVQKVAQLSMIIAEAINDANDGVYKDINYTPDQLNEIRIAGLMHDVGKITTPEYVVDKSTKLETIYDRIETIATRFEVLKKELELETQDKKIQLLQNSAAATEIDNLDKVLQIKLKQLDADLDFIREANIGGEFMSDDKIKRIEQIASYSLSIKHKKIPLLNEDEIENLSIRKGTLTESERSIINSHAKMSNEMLEALPFPKKLNRVPEIAGGHHEKLNGKGYPKGLTANELSLEARILALADIFEALTASDRPYKDGKKLSEAMRIIDFMVKDYELDPNLVQFFYNKNLHVEYAVKSLLSKQLDI